VVRSEVGVVDVTLRDGHQSLWATRMPTSMMLPIAERMDTMGFHAIDLMAALPVLPSVAAVTVADPATLPVTRPLVLTVATVVLGWAIDSPISPWLDKYGWLLVTSVIAISFAPRLSTWKNRRFLTGC